MRIIRHLALLAVCYVASFALVAGLSAYVFDYPLFGY